MAKALKITAAVILGLMALLVIGILIITLMIEPNDFKPRIESTAREQANLDLDISGDIGWSFWPSLGVEIGRTEARIAGEEELFAAFDEAKVSVAIWPLFVGEVKMDGVTLAGLELELVETPEGGNWEKIGARQAAEAEQPADAPQEEQPAAEIPLFIPSLTISDARVRYRVPADGTNIVVEHVNVKASDISLDEPFPLTASLRYQDQNNVRVDAKLDAQIAVDLATNSYAAAPLTLEAEIGGLTSQPVVILANAERIGAALDEDHASVRALVIETAGTRTTAGLDIEQLSTQPVFVGELKTEPFDANLVLRNLGVEPISTQNPEALKKVSLQASIGGEPGSLMLKPLTVKVDDSTVSGFAGLATFESGKIVFDLTLDRLVADGYLPPDTGVKETPTGDPEAGPESAGAGILPPLSDAPLLPLDTIRSLLLDGKLGIDSLKLKEMEAGDIRIAVKAADGVLTLEDASGKALTGSFSSQAKLDASQKTPQLSLNAKLAGVQLQPVMKFALDDDLFIGKLDMDASLKSNGNSEEALMQNANGQLSFKLADGTVRGMNLHSTLLSGIKDMLGAFSQLASLAPGQASGKLPAELSEDTRIVDLTGKARLEKEVAYMENFNAKLDRGTVTGKGYLNVRSQEFDLQLGMKSPEFSDNKYFRDRTWPIHCHGNLTGSPAKWCNYDKEGFQQIGKEIAAQAAKDKIKSKLGIQGEGDTAEEVIQDAAEKKAREKVDQKLEEGLKKLFK